MTVPKWLVWLIAGLLIFSAGAFVGVKYFAPALTQHHYTNTVEKPTIVQGEVKTVTDTQIAYVPKETIITKYIDSTGKEVTKEELEKTDLQTVIGKPSINIKLNGKEVIFNKADDEKYALEKNKIALNQTSDITFDATITPPTVDNTKRWGVGIGYGMNGLAGKLDFPIGKNNSIGGWVYGDKETASVGINIKF
jgi:hypothetical protein